MIWNLANLNTGYFIETHHKVNQIVDLDEMVDLEGV